MSSGIPPPDTDEASQRTYSAKEVSEILRTFAQQAGIPHGDEKGKDVAGKHVQQPSSTTSPSAPSSSSLGSPQSLPATSHSHTSPTNPDSESVAASGSGSQDPSGSRRLRVQLAPDQPLTTHGKPRERVYVACSQCRNRKVRCDGGKPECFNCSKRADAASDPCLYDSAPRRRGKDRTPGSRKLAPYIPKKTRTTRSRLEEAKRNKSLDPLPRELQPVAGGSGTPQAAGGMVSLRSTPPSLPPGPPPPESGLLRQVPRVSRYSRTMRNPSASHAVPLFLTESTLGVGAERTFDDDEDDEVIYIATEPSVQFTRETWWDALLTVYAAPTDRPDLPPVLTVDVRSKTSERIAADLRFLFQASLHWFSFVNIPRFFSSLFHPVTRQTIQPSLVLAALGLATFLQSSDMERGAKGREKALRLIDQAHATFDASINSGWIDIGLVQAAWVLAFFEIQAHPRLSSPRTNSGMASLDALIRCLSLTTLDVDDPRATVFVPRAVPTVPSNAPTSVPPVPLLDLWTSAVMPQSTTGGSHAHPVGLTGTTATINMPPGKWRCGCEAYSLGYHWPLARDLAPQWSEMPMWPKDLTAGEMLKEECRRLVWSSVMLTATHNTKTTAGTDWETQHLWMKDPSNYALLFPGENVAPPGAYIASSKDSVWALNMRALLLWHSSLRMRCDMNLTDADRAQFAMGAWLEIDTIEALLDRHTCVSETGFTVQMRDILFNTRMVVSHEFQRYIPEATTAPGQLFYHDKAERWMTHQLYMAKFFSQALRSPNVDANDHSRRNFLMFWFMSQISRALKLWDADHTLMIALDVARVLAPATEYLMLLWPCPTQRRDYERLRAELVLTCMEANIAPPERAIGYA
ncbi:hypothetical protein C2E23DRAFT_739894 [Lenzites betulinus]|nr:hypothetical protein C2E23DRAFT_739894 [Lenzites betulinus]